MELERAYREIEKRLDRLDFEALHRGFVRFPFAIYNEDRAFMDGQYFDRPGDFVANTAVVYKGRHTAIWNLDENAPDFDVLTSKIVHEMLHAFQNAAGETRWADERAALMNYRYDALNFSARLAEAELMKKCFAADDREAFERLLQLRKARMERFGYEYDYEARLEQIEGTANYVEMAALEQLDAAKAREKRERMLEDMNDAAKYLPLRAMTYLSGAAFIACLKKYTDMKIDEFCDAPFAVAALENVKACQLPEIDGRMEECLMEWKNGTEKIIRKTLEKDEIVLEGQFRLWAWNIYDAAYDGKYAVMNNFIGYTYWDCAAQTDEELYAAMKFLQGNFVAEVDRDMRMKRVWRR